MSAMVISRRMGQMSGEVKCFGGHGSTPGLMRCWQRAYLGLYGRAEAVTASAAAAAARRRVGNRVGVRGSRCIALHPQNIGSLFDLLACSYRRTMRTNWA